MSASDSYIVMRTNGYIEPRNWLHHRDHDLEEEARHAYWVEHLEEVFWDRW